MFSYFNFHLFFVRKTFDDKLDLPTDSWHLLGNDPESSVQETKNESHVKLVFKKREITELPKEEEKITTILTESELPPEVDAFVKGKNKYRHPYGDWKPVIRAEPLKRLVLVSFFSLILLFILFLSQRHIC